jgi:hypothetical protein
MAAWYCKSILLGLNNLESQKALYAESAGLSCSGADDLPGASPIISMVFFSFSVCDMVSEAGIQSLNVSGKA